MHACFIFILFIDKWLTFSSYNNMRFYQVSTFPFSRPRLKDLILYYYNKHTNTLLYAKRRQTHTHRRNDCCLRGRRECSAFRVSQSNRKLSHPWNLLSHGVGAASLSSNLTYGHTTLISIVWIDNVEVEVISSAVTIGSGVIRLDWMLRPHASSRNTKGLLLISIFFPIWLSCFATLQDLVRDIHRILTTDDGPRKSSKQTILKSNRFDSSKILLRASMSCKWRGRSA